MAYVSHIYVITLVRAKVNPIIAITFFLLIIRYELLYYNVSDGVMTIHLARTVNNYIIHPSVCQFLYY
jgi:hypothetical protein